MTISSSSSEAEEGLHWAYQPVTKATIPEDNGGHRGNGIDYFLDEIFKTKAIKPNPEADRHTLLRRVTINLTGLPPTVQEIEAFINDNSPQVYENMVDRLLASPHYGERWGRHWLDVARYVQGKVKVPGVNRIDMAEEYRDYVVRSFNSDKPYDRFITEQLAGDLLKGKDDDYLDRKVAPALLSIGPWFDECTDPNKLKLDIADEQISTVTKAFLALDFACSRCHDHKFDPIPTRDYYAMAGIFRSTKIIGEFSEFWKDGRSRLTQPLGLPGQIETAEAKKAKIRNLENERWAILASKRKEFIERYQADFEKRASSVVPAKQLKAWEAEDFSGYKNLKTVEGKYTPAIEPRVPLDQWVQYDFHLDEEGNFLLYLRYANPVDAPLKLELNREILGERLAVTSTGGREYQHYRWEAFGPFPFREGTNRIRLMADRHEPFPKLDAIKIVRDEATLPPAAIDRALVRYSHSRTFWPPTTPEMELILPSEELVDIKRIDAQISQLRAGSTLPETLSVTDRGTLIEEPIRVGGNTYQPKGEPVPRGVPTLFESIAGKYRVGPDTSGRIELARWMVDPENTLTARVMVNRLWHWHFGKGLVASTDNFGIQGSEPENLELLDWLAAEFMESGWSVKHIQRLIVTSRAYRRTSQPGSNVLLSAFPKRRLEAEVIYDGMLGTLDKVRRQPPGQPLDPNLSKDRAMYVLISSRSPKGLGHEIRKMFTLFGFDPSGRPIHDRPDAVTPDQALWFLNNPLPKYYADRLSEKLMIGGDRAIKGITPAFLSVIGHPPDPTQKKAAEQYVRESLKDGLSEKESLSRMILGLFSSERFTHLY